MKITHRLLTTIKDYNLTIKEAIFLYAIFYSLVDWIKELELTDGALSKLVMLNYINADKNSLTSIGENFVINFLVEEESIKEINLDFDEDKFNEIWMTFPKDDSFRTFPKTRYIRWDKTSTRKAYQEALKLYNHDTLLKALKREIESRTSNTGGRENMLKYMKSSSNWFHTKQYENFIEPEVEEDDAYGKDLF